MNVLLDPETFNKCVKEAAESGVKPIELRFIPIINFDEGFPIAYKTETQINSLIRGTMSQESYIYVSDVRDVGIDLLKHMIVRLIRTIQTFEKQGRNIEFLSMRCPSELIYKLDFYNTLKEILEKYPNFNRKKLCLEFPASVLLQDEKKAWTAIFDTKALNMTTMITGCGGKEFPVSKMVEVTPDYVILDPEATQWAGSRDKPQVLSSLVSYIKSMGIEAIAEGEEESRKNMRGTECIGFIRTKEKTLSLDEALNQKEEEE